MANLEKRIAYYTTGKIDEGKTTRKTFDTNNLIGIISVYDDGTREEEVIVSNANVNAAVETNVNAKIAKLRFEAAHEFKHDGGDTPEIIALRRANR